MSTLQGEPLGRVSMSKIKPYHEPLKAKAYVLEVGDTTNSSPREKIGICTNGSNHHNEESSYSHDKRKPCKFYDRQKMICKYLPHQQIRTPFVQQKWVGPYTIMRIHDDDTINIKTIYQKELGRWKSIKFIPYNWVDPNQVITFDQ